MMINSEEFLGWLSERAEAQDFGGIDDYLCKNFAEGAVLSPATEKLLKKIANHVLSRILQESDINWTTVRWIGRAYEPGFFFSHIEHQTLAKQMKTQRPIDGKTAVQHLVGIYRALGVSKNTKIAKDIERVFAAADITPAYTPLAVTPFQDKVKARILDQAEVTRRFAKSFRDSEGNRFVIDSDL